MNDIEIYLKSTEEDEGYWEQKGYRCIVVKIDNNYYIVSVFSILRLNQDFEYEFQMHGNFFIDPNLILVKEVTHKEIISVILLYYKSDNYYFSRLKPEKIDFELIRIY